jgi:hypothetical protein
MAAYAALWTGIPMEVQLMSRVQSIFLITVLSFILIRTAAAQVDLVDLGEVLGNSDFEDDLVHSQWTATVKGASYQVEAPVVNPVIVPKNASTPLEAPPVTTLSVSGTPTERISRGAWSTTPWPGSLRRGRCSK